MKINDEDKQKILNLFSTILITSRDDLNDFAGVTDKDRINAMNIANQDVKPTEPEIAQNVPEKDIVQPTEPTKDVTVNGN